ncbi:MULTISPECIES: hypothetical protein [unclassified Motilimonas]|uniref:hypothetical protein n=1 Tax=Motilimonas TaxID=1914248 RepID=UPI001E64C080|nr:MULTISPECIES: hypothetical protein [unclassified Motilimonas]MCE0557860.1 hypothetical protein [Motilimonas sp. E26]MDO6525602.1 hypothetical protein [Motilimonas sp. 1_MG-2023]
MPNYVVLCKEEVLVTVECGTQDAQEEFQALTEQGFHISSQVIAADSTKEALYFYENDPQLYAIDPSSNVVVDSVIAALVSLGVQAI